MPYQTPYRDISSYYPNWPGRNQGPSWGMPNAPAAQNPDDPGAMARADRIREMLIQRGYDEELAGRMAQAYASEADYGGMIPELYGDIWAGGGGYTPGMAENILQEEDLRGLYPSAEDLASGQYTPDETTAMGGLPYQAFDLYGNLAGGVRTTRGEGERNVRGAYGLGTGRLQDAVGQMRGMYEGAVDPTRLRMDPAYATAMRGTMGQGAEGIRGAIRDPSLGITDEYQRQAGMSDQEVRETAEAAGQDVGAGYQSAIDRMEAQARASGAAHPLAVAAMRAELEREGAGQKAKALLSARLGAREAQRAAATGVEKTRLGAQQYRAGLGLEGEGELLGRGLQTEQNIESTRLGAERGLSEAQREAARTTGAAGVGAAQYALGLGTGMEQDIAGRALGTDIDLMNRGLGMYESAEERAANRQANIAAGNRAGRIWGSTEGFQRPYTLNQTLSNRYQNVYAPWLDVQAEGRQVPIQQQGYWGGQANTTMGNRLRTWQIGQGGAQAGTQGYANWQQYRQSKPGLFSRIVGGVVGAIPAAASIFGGGQGARGAATLPWGSATSNYGTNPSYLPTAGLWTPPGYGR